MEFKDLIRKTSEISTARCMAFFFECFQLDYGSIKVATAEKKHMVVYLVPPSGVSFHQDGVGLLVTCLAEMLMYFKGSLNELQFELREKLASKMLSILHVPSDELFDFKTKHLPVHYLTSTCMKKLVMPVSSYNCSSHFTYPLCVNSVFQ